MTWLDSFTFSRDSSACIAIPKSCASASVCGGEETAKTLQYHHSGEYVFGPEKKYFAKGTRSSAKQSSLNKRETAQPEKLFKKDEPKRLGCWLFGLLCMFFKSSRRRRRRWQNS
jgi:hypothetical protein